MWFATRRENAPITCPQYPDRIWNPTESECIYCHWRWRHGRSKPAVTWSGSTLTDPVVGKLANANEARWCKRSGAAVLEENDREFWSEWQQSLQQPSNLYCFEGRASGSMAPSLKAEDTIDSGSTIRCLPKRQRVLPRIRYRGSVWCPHLLPTLLQPFIVHISIRHVLRTSEFSDDMSFKKYA